jgi:hypothetical protein
MIVSFDSLCSQNSGTFPIEFYILIFRSGNDSRLDSVLSSCDGFSSFTGLKLLHFQLIINFTFFQFKQYPFFFDFLKLVSLVVHVVCL